MLTSDLTGRGRGHISEAMDLDLSAKGPSVHCPNGPLTYVLSSVTICCPYRRPFESLKSSFAKDTWPPTGGSVRRPHHNLLSAFWYR